MRLSHHNGTILDCLDNTVYIAVHCIRGRNWEALLRRLQRKRRYTRYASLASPGESSTAFMHCNLDNQESSNRGYWPRPLVMVAVSTENLSFQLVRVLNHSRFFFGVPR